MNKKAYTTKNPHVAFSDASLLRRYTIFFILMSMIPTVVLYDFYWQSQNKGFITIKPEEFNLLLIFVVLGVMLGYFKMRQIMLEMIELVKSSREALSMVLTPKEIEKLSVEKNEIAVLAGSFTEITHKLEENVKSLELAKKTLHSILEKVGRGISNMQNIDTFLELIMETMADALEGSTGVLLDVREDQKKYSIKTVYGLAVYVSDEFYNTSPDSIIGRVLHTRKPVILNDPQKDPLVVECNEEFFTHPIIAAPLMIKNKITGIIVVSGRKSGKYFEEEDVTLLGNLATQTAVAIENSRLSKDRERTYFETISALALAVDAKDKYSRGHLDRVSKYCIRIAENLGLDKDDISVLRDGARLHDIGKIGVPDAILYKPGKLDTDEWEVVKKHPEIGESIIKPISSLSHLCDLIRHHHEKLDGSGYPDGLKGEEISPLVRILTIADIYDALTTDRSYRSRMSHEKAVSVLREMDNQLDQDIVEAFAESFYNK
jgi:HD-GYP domain-containing protein (c-di-GMP phosphodiesterase class II)/Sec-independent protein translocase protein TatA